MKHVAAYALLVLGGKDKPTADEVNEVLKQAGVKGDSAQVDALIAAVSGKAFHEIVSEGLSAIGAAGPASSATVVAADAPKAAGAAKVEEKEEEPEEEEDVDMGGLFGDDDY